MRQAIEEILMTDKLSSRIQDAIAEAFSILEQSGKLDRALKKLRPEDEAKARAMANSWIQWRNNRTIN